VLHYLTSLAVQEIADELGCGQGRPSPACAAAGKVLARLLADENDDTVEVRRG
jgi:hypothetical protein